MFKFPLVVIYAIVALNISVFTGLLQADLLIIQSPTAKIISWVLTIAAWTVAYLNRHKFYTIRLTSKMPESNLHHE
jgi:tellurite resistance protein TehA-like permease